MKRTMFLMLGLVAASALGGTAHAAPKKAKPKAAAKAKPKPAVKKPAAPANNGVRGMVPLAGVDNAQFGTTYTLGEGQNLLNFTLNSAQFQVERVNIGESIHAPKADEKLLVLNYTVHNPNKDVSHYDWASLKFTAVDATNENREYVSAVGRKETGEALSIELKPAQKINAFTVIVVPAKGVIPKLIVTPNWGGGVLRYDLRGKVTPLPAPFGEGEGGVTARSEVTGEAGKYYPAAYFDIKLVNTAYSNGPLGEYELEEGKRYFVATLSFRNASPTEAHYNWPTFKPSLTDADGENVEWNSTMLKATRNEAADGALKPGAEYTVRYFFALPKDVAAKTFALTEGESRTYTFDVSATK